jgi:transcriptional regulator with XRE-family HTH domain
MSISCTPGQLLRIYRDMSGLTQLGLASASFCSVMMIRKIENDLRRPSYNLAHRLAVALKVPPEERDTFVRMMRGLPELPHLTSSGTSPEQMTIEAKPTN